MARIRIKAEALGLGQPTRLAENLPLLPAATLEFQASAGSVSLRAAAAIVQGHVGTAGVRSNTLVLKSDAG